MDSIKNTLEAVFRELERKKNEAPAEDPEEIFRKALGTRDAAHAQFKNFRAGVIYIGVDSTGWLYQLGMKKTELLSKIRALSPGLNVKDMRFSLGIQKASTTRGNGHGKIREER
jgi:hypothetical protein